MFQALWLTILVSSLSYVLGFDMNRNDNLAVYWGQNSFGAANPTTDPATWQKNLAFYCADDTIDTIPAAFLTSFFSTGGLPSASFSNICSGNLFPGTSLPNCDFLAPDVQTCQSKGKIVTLSMGGGGASGITFSSADQAEQFGTTIWNLFLGGTSDTRPFGTAVLDGVDLDIESGSTEFFDSFINQIRTLSAGASKPYYITAAPQCPFPDAALGTVLNKAGFDAIYIQFYNNFCGLSSFNDTNAWNFATWDNWAKTTAVNKNVKVYIGAPAAPSAANAGSYVDAATLSSIIQQTRANFSSFGGAMLWDASQAFANDRYDVAVKASLRSGAKQPPAKSEKPTMSKTSAVTKTSAMTKTGVATKSTAVATSAIASPSTPVVHNTSATTPLNHNLTTTSKHSRDFRL